jgi:hypothetical protein
MLEDLKKKGRELLGVGKTQEKPQKPEQDDDFIVDGFENEESAVRTVEGLFEASRERMYGVLRQWVTNLLMFRGEQHFLFDLRDPYIYDNGNLAYPNERHPDEEDFVARVDFAANLIQGHTEGWVAKMVHNAPIIQVFPATDDQEDREVADVNNDLIDWKREQQHWDEKYLEAVTITGIMGNCFLKACYNTEAGPVKNPLEGMKEGDLELLSDRTYRESKGLPEEAKNGKLRFEDLVREGDVETIVVPPYEISVPDENVRNIHECGRLIHSYITSLQDIKEQYPNHPRIDEVKTGLDDYGYQIWFTEKVRSMTEGGYRGSTNAADSEADHGTVIDANEKVLVHEYWGKPTKKRPKGVFIKVAGGIMLEPSDLAEMENPYWHQELPFAHFKQVDDRINFWATSKVEQGIQAQQEYNAGASQIIESRNLTANPITLMERNAVVNKDDVLNVPGEVWEVRPGRMDSVRRLESQSLPAYVHQFLYECRALLEQIFSDYQPDRGESQQGDSGYKVRQLQMASEQRHVPYARGVAGALTRHWTQILMLIAQFTDDEKVGYIVGSENERSYFRWSRAAMIGAGRSDQANVYASEDDYMRSMVYSIKNRMDIRTTVVPGKSHQTAMEDAAFLIESGALQMQNPAHAAIVLNMMDYAYETPQIMVDQRQQAAQAQKENDDFFEGKMILPPGQYEHHDVHLQKHKRMTTTERFRALNPKVQAMMMQHIQLHEEAKIAEPLRMAYVQQKVVAQLQQMFGPLMIGTGAPPGAGGQQEKPNGQGRPQRGQGAGGGRPAGTASAGRG